MKFKLYDKLVTESSIYPPDMSIIYPAIGMSGEVGEVANKVKKVIRDKNGVFGENERCAIASEISDVLWYLTATAHDLGYTLEDIVQLSYNKIQHRMSNNTLHGDGDDR